MKILITGATGFIGGRLVDFLLRQPDQYEVFFSGRKAPKDDSFRERGAVYLPGDLTDLAYCQKITQHIDVVVHSAGLAGTWGAYEEYFRANVLATQNLLKASRENGVKRFVNISSPSIYFDFLDQFNLKESQLPAKFSNHYARTKWEAEKLVKSFHSPQMQTVSLRPRAVIGAGDQNIFPRLIRLQKKGSLVQIGSGENIVDITTVGNLLYAIVLCFAAPESAMGGVYNISNGKPEKFWELVEKVLLKVGLPTKRKKLPYFFMMGLAQINQFWARLRRAKKEPALLPISVGVLSFSMTMDISQAREKLGYQPRFTTEDGINEFMQSWEG